MTKRLTTILLSLAAVVALSAVAAASASAKPAWLVHGAELKAGEKAGVESENASNEEDGFVPKQLAVPALAIAIVCSRESDTGEIFGGEPGTDKVTAKFTGCKVFSNEGTEEKKPSRPPFNYTKELTACSVKGGGGVAGEIIVKSRSTLAYKVGTAGTTRPIVVEVFAPEAEGGAFAVIEITGASCAPKGEYEVKGSAISLVETQKPTGEKPYEEVLVNTLNFTYVPTVTSGKVTACKQEPTEYETAAKEKVVDTLLFGTHPACFYDVDWVTLAAGGKWGVSP